MFRQDSRHVLGFAGFRAMGPLADSPSMSQSRWLLLAVPCAYPDCSCKGWPSEPGHGRHGANTMVNEGP